MNYKTEKTQSKTGKNHVSVLDLILSINKTKINKSCYKHKVINLGHVIKYYYYTDPIWTGFESTGGRMENNDEKKKIENRLKVTGRIRNKIINYSLANFNSEDKFITLTFKEDVKDIKTANAQFKKFIQRLRYKIDKKFRYIAVIEFMQNGRVHYHMMSDLGFIKKAELTEIWRNGHIKINRMDKQNKGKGVDNVGAYLVKYMNKDTQDKRLLGNKAYLVSRNIRKPEVLKGSEAEKFMIDKGILKNKPVDVHMFERKGKGFDGGIIFYEEYNLLRS